MKGIKTGGRQKGTRNKEAVQRERAIAEAAGRPVAPGEKMGIDYMRDAAKQFYALAARYQRGQPEANEDKFVKYTKLFHDCGDDISQFELPKMAAVAVKNYGNDLGAEDLSNDAIDALERVLSEILLARGSARSAPHREIKTIN